MHVCVCGTCQQPRLDSHEASDFKENEVLSLLLVSAEGSRDQMALLNVFLEQLRPALA